MPRNEEPDNAGRRPGGPEREGFLVEGEERKSRRDFGLYLRRERELRNITLDEIAQVTRVNKRYLVLIEEGREEGLPALPFVKGFLSAYARYIGLNPEEVLTFFEEVHLAETEPEGKESPVAVAGKGRRRWLVLLLPAAAMLAFAVFWLLSRPSPPPPAVVGAPAAPELTIPATEAPVAEPPAEREEHAAAGGTGVRLALAAVEKSWVYAVIDETSIRDFFLQPGERVELEGQRLINLTLGNSGGVAVTFNGRELGILGQSREVRRDLLFTWDERAGARVGDPFSFPEEGGP